MQALPSHGAIQNQRFDYCDRQGFVSQHLWKDTPAVLSTSRTKHCHATPLLPRLNCLGSSRPSRKQQYLANTPYRRRSRGEHTHDSQHQAVTDVATADPPAKPGGNIAGAKQLFQVAINSLDIYDSSDPPTIDEEVSDPFGQELNGSEDLPAAHAYSKANYEVLRIASDGKVRRLFVKRRDLLREHRLQPRDLRRLDTPADSSKASPSVTIKEDVLLLNLGGCRAIVTAEKALLLEPNGQATAKEYSQRFLDILLPRVQATAGARAAVGQAPAPGTPEYVRALLDGGRSGEQAARAPPYELEVLEAALIVATGRFDAEVLTVTRRVSHLLTKLPREITPVNLEELRRIKSTLVELEDRAEAVVKMLEELLDDEDELRELNLSSRPRREMRREQRERARLERELERAREMKEEYEERMQQDEDDASGGGNGAGSMHSTSSTGTAFGGLPTMYGVPSLPGMPRPGVPTSPGASPLPSPLSSPAPSPLQTADWSVPGLPSSRASKKAKGTSRSERASRLAELRAKFGDRDRDRDKEGREGERERWQQRRREDDSDDEDDDRDWRSMADVEDNYADIQEEIEEYQEQQEEEEELEEIEDLLEYYLQKAGAVQSEAERLLEGARDLEESIGVSLSARRFELSRLELTLSIGSFAASIGAMIAGIFGMNMRNTMESSVLGFWGVTFAIVAGCCLVYLAVMRYTRRKRIL